MLKTLKRLLGARRAPLPIIDAAYRSVMQAALSPDLYRTGLAEDTFDGRFTMTALHGGIALRQLRRGGEAGRTLADALYRRLFDGFDYALREQGAGDATIARKARKLGESFFGLARAMDSAFETADAAAAIEAVLVRNDVGGASPARLAALLVDHDRAIASQTVASLLSGAFEWADIAG